MIRLNIQFIFYKQDGRIGPGKIRLLELIEETGYISAAARELQMSYRQGWLLLDEINGVSRTSTGGTPTRIPAVASTQFGLGLEAGSTNSATASYAGFFVYDRALNSTEVGLLYNTVKANLAGRGITVQ